MALSCSTQGYGEETWSCRSLGHNSSRSKYFSVFEIFEKHSPRASSLELKEEISSKQTRCAQIAFQIAWIYWEHRYCTTERSFLRERWVSYGEIKAKRQNEPKDGKDWDWLRCAAWSVFQILNEAKVIYPRRRLLWRKRRWMHQQKI